MHLRHPRQTPELTRARKALSATRGLARGVLGARQNGAAKRPSKAAPALPLTDRATKAKKTDDDILEQCRYKPDQYREDVCTAENKASWKARAAAGSPLGTFWGIGSAVVAMALLDILDITQEYSSIQIDDRQPFLWGKLISNYRYRIALPEE